MPPKLLLDTNVWLDYFIDRSSLHDQANALVRSCIAKDVVLMAALPSLKDCFFLVSLELKRIERSQRGMVSEQAANAIRKVAWSCVTSMRKLAYVVPADDTDVVEAAIMRTAHPDFEDNLVVAAALRAQADYLVTSDKSLARHAPIECLSLDEALAIVG